MGPPPSPVPPAKRRYDQAPSGHAPNPQRSLASNGDAVSVDEDASILSMPPKASIIDEFVPPNPAVALQRSTSDEVAQKTRVQHQLPAQMPASLLPQRRVDDSLQTLRPQMTTQQRHPQGPRSGFFTEERSELPQQTQPSQVVTQHLSLHQPFGRQAEKHRVDQPQRPQAILPQQRHIVAQQVPGVQQHYQGAPAVSSPPSYQQQESAVQHHLPVHTTHSRQSSSTASGPLLQTITKQEPDAAPFRRHDSVSQALNFGPSPAHSPVSMRPQSIFGTQQELIRPNSTPAAPSMEQTRPNQAKRSNLINLLNPDEPAEAPPPPKRLPLEHTRPQAAPSPPSSSFSNVTLQQPHTLSHREEIASTQPSSGSRNYTELSSVMGRQPARLHQAATLSQDNTSSYSRDLIHRWDPRQSERTQSQTLSQFPRPPASTQSDQMNPTQSSLSQSHHHTFLSQSLQHPSHVPSPPPQTQPHPSLQTPYRTPSTSSHHSRMPSYANSGPPAPQGPPSNTGAPSAIQPPSSHPHSAVQSPVPSIHRSHGSMSLESRNTLQGFETRNPLHQSHPFQTPQQPQQLEQRIHSQHHETREQKPLQLQHQQQQRASLMSSGGYPGPPHRTFTPTPPGGLFLGPGQHQQSHQRRFSQEGRADERR